MKNRKNLFFPLAALTLLSLSPMLHAAPLTWNGGAGTWQVGNVGQWGSAWVNGDTATFNGPGGAITLGGAITTGSAPLAFTSGSYNLSAGAPLVIALGGGNVAAVTESNFIRLGAVTATIGANVTLNRDTWFIDGATTATSTFNLTGGSLTAAAGNTTIREATVNVGTGSVLRTPGSLICGTTGDGAALNVTGGTVTIEGPDNSLLMANSGATASSATVTISSGAISFTNGSNPAGLRYAAQTGVFNLDGGVVTVSRVFESNATATSTFNFNGGTLRLRRTSPTNVDFMTGLNNAVVKSGGAIIDTAGNSATLGQALTPGAPSGGLTKNGLGTLTLSGASTYTGATTVTAGRLSISGSLVSDVSVAANATLGGEGSATGSTSFATSGSTFAFNPATPGAFTATSLSLGSSVIQLASDGAMIDGTSYLVMTNSAGFSGAPTVNFRSPSRGFLAYSGNNLNFTPSPSASLSWKGGDATNPTFWDTETTANWDNVGSPDRFFNLDTVVFDDTASSYSVAIQGGSVKPTSVTFNHSSTYTLSGGAIEGTLGITKDGTGTVILGNANTYTGNTSINGGAVQVTGGSAIANTGLVTLTEAPGVSFGVLGSETIGAISGGGPTGGNVSISSGQTLTLGSGTQIYDGTVSGSGTLTIAGAVQTLTGVTSNAGGLNVTAGSLTLAAENTYTGTTTVGANSGIILTKAAGLGAIGSGNGTTIVGSGDAASGQIGLFGGITVNEKVTGSGNGHVSPATVAEFTSQQRGIIQSVSGNNTFAGDVEINSTGTTRIGTQDGASLTLSGNITRSVGVTNVTVLFRVGNTGGDFLTLSGAGNDFDEVSLFSASLTTSTGVRLGVDDALPVQARLKASNSSPLLTTLDLDGYEQTIGGLATDPNSGGQYKIINRNLGNPSTLTLANTQDTTSSLGAISNDGGAGGVINIVKTGAFTQGLGAVNTYTGTTSIQGGRLNFLQQVSLYNNTAASWTPANISVNSAATLGLSVGGTGEFTATDVGTLITSLTAINDNGLKAGSTLGLNVSVDTEVTTALTNSTGTGGGAVSLHKSGTAKLTLSGANSYSGNTTVAAGTLQLNTNNTANDASTVTIATTNAFLELNFDESGGPVSDTVDTLFIGGVQQSAGTYKATTNVTDTGTAIPQITGPGTLTVLTGPAGFAGWQDANNTTGGINEDHDQDGVANGIEFFLSGPVDSTGFTSLPGVVPAGGSFSITWTKATGYEGDYGTDFFVETSPDLANPWTQAPEGTGAGTVEITPSTVKYIFPNPSGAKNFARLKVTGP